MSVFLGSEQQRNVRDANRNVDKVVKSVESAACGKDHNRSKSVGSDSKGRCREQGRETNASFVMITNGEVPAPSAPPRRVSLFEGTFRPMMRREER